MIPFPIIIGVVILILILIFYYFKTPNGNKKVMDITQKRYFYLLTIRGLTPLYKSSTPPAFTPEQRTKYIYEKFEVEMNAPIYKVYDAAKVVKNAQNSLFYDGRTKIVVPRCNKYLSFFESLPKLTMTKVSDDIWIAKFLNYQYTGPALAPSQLGNEATFRQKLVQGQVGYYDSAHNIGYLGHKTPNFSPFMLKKNNNATTYWKDVLNPPSQFNEKLNPKSQMPL